MIPRMQATVITLSPGTRILAIILACLFSLIVIELIRRRKLQERYTVLWFLYALLLIIVALFPALLGAVAGNLGIHDPNAALFLLAFIAVGIMLLSLTVSESKHSEHITRLAQEIALLKAQLNAQDRDKTTQ